jgi:hypothetical protein
MLILFNRFLLTFHSFRSLRSLLSFWLIGNQGIIAGLGIDCVFSYVFSIELNTCLITTIPATDSIYSFSLLFKAELLIVHLIDSCSQCRSLERPLLLRLNSTFLRFRHCWNIILLNTAPFMFTVDDWFIFIAANFI